MILTISEVVELKKLIMEKYNQTLHLHDTCGGQYFTLDKEIKGIEKFVEEYLKKNKKQSKVIFEKDKLSFTIL